MLKKNNSCGHSMSVRFKKYVQPSLSLKKFRYLCFFEKKELEVICWDFRVVLLQLVYLLQATALIYYKRFYLQWSVMEHNPKHIM